MMVYVLVPHTARGWAHARIFLSYAFVEQIALQTARAIVATGGQEDWCTITAYEGTDEVLPRFVYWVEGGRLFRDDVPSPSP